jgi:hypothetical protein
LTFLFIIASSFAPPASKKPQTFNRNLRVILIRHAEKSGDGYNLSCTGLNRAFKLPAVLKSKYGIPDHVYVPTLSRGPGDETKDCRMFQTVTPFAVKYRLAVNSSFAVGDEQRLVDKIRTNSGTVLAVWEHKRLIDIASMRGVRSMDLNWTRDEFDKIWLVTITNGHAVLTEDKEDIHPDSNCSF